MSPSPEPIPQEFSDALFRVRDRLGRIGDPTIFFSSIGSTNDVAMEIAAERDGEGTVVIAEAQTRGRGRRGRTWFSPPGAGLYVSVVLSPARARRAPERATALLTLAAGVALAEGIEAMTGLGPVIKWPNDLLIGGRKVAGILAEGVTGMRSGASLQSVVLGYGVNVGAAAFPPELGDRATSLELELGRAIDGAALCAETLACLAQRYGHLLDGEFDAILDAWRVRAPKSQGARVSWETSSGPLTGLTAGIDGSGALLVRIGDRVERLFAGEIRWD